MTPAPQLNRSVAHRSLAAIAAAAALVALAAGCSLVGLGLSVAPMGLQAIEGVTVAAGQSASGNPNTTAEEDASKCEQLRSGLPYVTEVRKDSNGAFEIRQYGVRGSSDKPQWTVVPAKDSAADGWKTFQMSEAQFSPPLETSLGAEKGAHYLIFAAAQANDTAENEQAVSFIGFFGPADGTFTWGGRTYNYAVAKKLPCFPVAS